MPHGLRYQTTRPCRFGSIPGHGRIHFISPSEDAALQVMDFTEARLH